MYPPIHAGDPEWRDYFTVNLLNLPNHYHNGGIWPFIGGLWVRYIHKLGMPEVARQELVKLARLCSQGVSSSGNSTNGTTASRAARWARRIKPGAPRASSRPATTCISNPTTPTANSKPAAIRSDYSDPAAVQWRSPSATPAAQEPVAW